MSKKPYLKTPLTYEEQLEQLKSRKLHIESDEKALHLLKHLSYLFIPIQKGTTIRF